MLSDERLREMLAGTEGATPGPWSCCDDRCKCTGVNARDHPVASVIKGDWGDDYPSLRFKEGGPGAVSTTSVEPYMAQVTYGTVPIDEAMRNRAHIAACDPDTVRSILTELLSRREANAKMAEALEATLAWIDAVPADTPLPAMPGFDRDDVDAALALHRGGAR